MQSPKEVNQSILELQSLKIWYVTLPYVYYFSVAPYWQKDFFIFCQT